MSSKPRVGYVPYSTTLAHPGDYRRFAGYAKSRKLSYEVAHPDRKYDLVVLTEWADISIWRNYPHGKIVYDFVDSYLAIPRTDIRGCLRGIAKFISRQHRQLQLSYWEAIRNMCRRSDAVVCTTEDQRSLILPFCDNVHVVLDAHDAVASQVKKDYGLSDPVKLVWEGLPSNISQLGTIRRVLRELGRRYRIELNVVTDLEGALFLGKFWKVQSAAVVRRIFDRTRMHAWDKNTFAGVITGCDIAVIPIDVRNPVAAGKPQNKLLLLWRMGMPVVTSATAAYSRAMNEAGQALTCKDDAEWLTNLERLILDEEARRYAGESGRAYAAGRFGEARTYDQWDAVFRSVGLDFAVAS